MQSTLAIPTMKCGGCVSAVETALADAGASDVAVVLESKTATFSSGDDLQSIISAIKAAGFAATPVG